MTTRWAVLVWSFVTVGLFLLYRHGPKVTIYSDDDAGRAVCLQLFPFLAVISLMTGLVALGVRWVRRRRRASGYNEPQQSR